MILYNFATDCVYSDYIQPELIRYLLPFYEKTMEQAVRYQNKMAMDIYFEFNSALFSNHKNFENAVGEKNYTCIMEYYRRQTIRKMEMKNLDTLVWISLFNTTVAFCDDNIRHLFSQIFKGSLRLKYSFFQYLSILLFKESDNLCVMDETRAFWTSDIWDFDEGYSSKGFFWSDNTIEFFDKEIGKERIKILFKEVRPFLCDILEPEAMYLHYEEMNQSFATGVFCVRKAEFLKKMKGISEKHRYWDTTF